MLELGAWWAASSGINNMTEEPCRGDREMSLKNGTKAFDEFSLHH